MSIEYTNVNGPRREKKTVIAVCEQQRHGPACPSAQTDQAPFLFSFWKVSSKFTTSEISMFYLVCVAEGTGLSLALSETEGIH